MLSLSIFENARLLKLYSPQYEQTVETPKKEYKRIIKIKAPANDVIEPVVNEEQKNKPKRPQINYFAGPHCVFNPRMK